MSNPFDDFDFAAETFRRAPDDLRRATAHKQPSHRLRRSGSAEIAPKPAGPFRFDPYRRAKSATLKASIRELMGILEAREEGRQRRRRASDAIHFEAAVEALTCNLLVCHMVNPGRTLAVPLANAVMHMKGRHKPAAYGEHFRTAKQLLEDAGLVREVQHGFRVNASNKQPTLIELDVGAASKLLPVGSLTWDDFRHEPWTDLIILKPRKLRGGTAPEAGATEGASVDHHHAAARLPLPATPEVQSMEDEVRTLNAALEAASFGVDAGAVVSWEDRRTGQLIDPTQRQLRRIFNNGSLEEGGRLYHGFWETMPRDVRYAALRIEGEPVANVDFRSLFPRLSYVHAGATPTMDDLYDIDGHPEFRDEWKHLFNALLFLDRLPRQWPDSTGAPFRARIKLNEAIAKLKERHSAIAHLFGTGIGLKLMYTESRILLTALPRLYAAGIVALPLHDSVLTAKSKAEAAKAIMEEAYREVTGQNRAFVTIG
jgi:hypothetical protein